MGLGERWQRAAPVVAMIYSLPAGTFAGALIGWLVDRSLGTAPVFTIVVTILGFAAGMLRLIQGLDRSPHEPRPPGPPNAPP